VPQYDKYENDNVPLYPETYPAAELLHDIVQPFHVLARQAEVHLI
jgi:hypothetical protein